MLLALHWELKRVMPLISKDESTGAKRSARFPVLMALLLSSDHDLRCYPSTDVLEHYTGCASATVQEARDYLKLHGAYLEVPYTHRMGDEVNLPRRQAVYQMTGMIWVNGNWYPTIVMDANTAGRIRKNIDWLPDDGGLNSSIKILLSEISLGEISATKILATETKVLSLPEALSPSKSKSPDKGDSSSGAGAPRGAKGKPSKGNVSGEFTSTSYYLVGESAKQINVKPYKTKAEAQSRADELATGGYEVKVVRGSDLNTNASNYKDYQRKQPQRPRVPVYDTIAIRCFRMKEGFDLATAGGGSEGSRIGKIIKALAVETGRTFNDLKNDEAVAAKIAIMVDLYIGIEGLSEPRDVTVFLGAWNTYGDTADRVIAGKTTVESAITLAKLANGHKANGNGSGKSANGSSKHTTSYDVKPIPMMPGDWMTDEHFVIRSAMWQQHCQKEGLYA